jgi:hypothetical protein
VGRGAGSAARVPAEEGERVGGGGEGDCGNESAVYAMSEAEEREKCDARERKRRELGNGKGGEAGDQHET